MVRAGNEAALSMPAQEAGMKVREVMTSDPVVVSPDTSIEAVLALMRERGIRHVPVVDTEGIVGMVSDRDLTFIHSMPGVFTMLSQADVKEVLESPVATIIKSRFLVDRDVVTVSPEDDASRAVEALLMYRVGALPVVEGEEVVGVVSVIDVLRQAAECWS
ncbi:CBS domain-containing protein [Bradymonadaceae bacterium TMQ3]|nr:CBS domain-containing protein [Bradymonadaceae bacterium TMQ3]TXC74847.1 CBS domain-containing protein [Bradymonadales bacterium TMQ1]